MENKNFVYKGWRTSGFLMLAVDLLLLAGSVAGIVFGAMRLDAALPGGGWLLAAGIVGVLLSLLLMGGFMLLEPNEARVMVFFGNYRGTFYETGYWWVNPFMSAKPISMRARNLNVDPIKVNDKTGNPILIGLVLVWRIKRDDIYKAVFEIDAASATPGQGVNATERMNILQNFVNVQSDAALRQVAGCYAYDDNGTRQEALTLRSNSEEINQQLETKLNERLAMAGIEVMEARINYLAYAPEIAAVMLRRQQADAVIAAREKIVEGAVSMVHMALERLADEEVVELDEERARPRWSRTCSWCSAPTKPRSPSSTPERFTTDNGWPKRPIPAVSSCAWMRRRWMPWRRGPRTSSARSTASSSGSSPTPCGAADGSSARVRRPRPGLPTRPGRPPRRRPPMPPHVPRAERESRAAPPLRRMSPARGQTSNRRAKRNETGKANRQRGHRPPLHGRRHAAAGRAFRV